MGNLRLISQLLKNDAKLILSTGGSDFKIIKTVDFIQNYSNKMTLLHCVSTNLLHRMNYNCLKLVIIKNSFKIQ